MPASSFASNTPLSSLPAGLPDAEAGRNIRSPPEPRSGGGRRDQEELHHHQSPDELRGQVGDGHFEARTTSLPSARKCTGVSFCPGNARRMRVSGRAQRRLAQGVTKPLHHATFVLCRPLQDPYTPYARWQIIVPRSRLYEPPHTPLGHPDECCALCSRCHSSNRRRSSSSRSTSAAWRARWRSKSSRRCVSASRATSRSCCRRASA